MSEREGRRREGGSKDRDWRGGRGESRKKGGEGGMNGWTYVHACVRVVFSIISSDMYQESAVFVYSCTLLLQFSVSSKSY